MTLEEVIKMLESRLDCMHRSSSGIDEDCNSEKCEECYLNYAQGTVGDQQEALKEAISALEKQMSTIEPEQRWVPCSPETMPKKTGHYLVQYTRKYCRNEMAVAFYSVEEARCDDDYTWEIETFSDIKEVIAWMPLPKPYKEGRKECR